MSRVITFSRTFPGYHPRKGEPTYFVEKLYESIYPNGFPDHFDFFLEKLNPEIKPSVFELFFQSINTEKGILPKNHTVRAVNRWKAGDKFSPRVWSGKPYNSKMITITPDIEIKKVWNCEMRLGLLTDQKDFFIEGHKVFFQMNKLAENDGLTKTDLYDWFNKPFKGQIICWNENVNY